MVFKQHGQGLEGGHQLLRAENATDFAFNTFLSHGASLVNILEKVRKSESGSGQIREVRFRLGSLF
jgi:hypothetical protein